MTQSGLSGLITETSQPLLAGFRITDDLGPTGDSVLVSVIGIGEGEERAFADRFEQAKTNKLRRQSYRIMFRCAAPE